MAQILSHLPPPFKVHTPVRGSQCGSHTNGVVGATVVGTIVTGSVDTTDGAIVDPVPGGTVDPVPGIDVVGVAVPNLHVFVD
jgi:hypothetical protein